MNVINCAFSFFCLIFLVFFTRLQPIRGLAVQAEWLLGNVLGFTQPGHLNMKWRKQLCLKFKGPTWEMLFCCWRALVGTRYTFLVDYRKKQRKNISKDYTLTVIELGQCFILHSLSWQYSVQYMADFFFLFQSREFRSIVVFYPKYIF